MKKALVGFLVFCLILLISSIWYFGLRESPIKLEKRKLSKEEISMVTSITFNDPNLNQILKESKYEVEGCWASLKYEGSNVTKIRVETLWEYYLILNKIT